MSGSKFTGSCLCGGVQYEFTGKPTYLVNCHCSMCRRAIGAIYGTYLRIPSVNFRTLKDDTKKIYKSSEKIERHFCSNCGASIMDTSSSYPETVYLLAGTLNGDPGIPLTAHTFTNYKVPWITIDDGAKSCGETELYEELIKMH